MEAIYDRNLLDVQIAKEFREKILKNGFESLSDEEKAQWLTGLKGCINYTDLNRIEKNCATLSDIFNLNLITKTDWSVADALNARNADFARIRSNVEKIRQTKYVYSTTPSTPTLPLNRYDKINDLERILYDVYTLYNINATNYDYMGELYDTTYELYDMADFTYFNNMRRLPQMDDEIFCDEEIGVI